MPSTVNPPPRAGSAGSGRRSSPASCAARSRCAMARRQRRLREIGQRSRDLLQGPDAADIGDRHGQRQMRLARRSAAAIRSRGAGGCDRRHGQPSRQPPPGPAPGHQRAQAAASRTARSARNGLLPPSARSIAAKAGRPASCAASVAAASGPGASDRWEASDGAVNRSISRSAAPRVVPGRPDCRQLKPRAAHWPAGWP